MQHPKKAKRLSLYFYSGIFIILFIGSVILLRHNVLLNSGGKILFDHYSTDIKITTYDTDGKIKAILTAKKATHFKASEKTLLESPYLITYQGPARVPWHIQSNTAIVNQPGTEALLIGNVILHQLPAPGHPPVTIKTTEMVAYLKKSYAKTTQPVTILRQGTTIHGVGMTANLQTGEYSLLSQSHAVIDLQNQPKN